KALEAQEILLCAADKLAEIADTVTPITWESDPGFISGPDRAIHATITIPPQATKDKFIVRDMAINVLAHLARLETDTRPLTAFNDHIIQGFPTCLDAYAAGEPTAFSVSSYLPPVQTAPNASTIDSLRASRLQYKAHILRGAERLLRDLVEKSVHDDLAGSERMRGLAG